MAKKRVDLALQNKSNTDPAPHGNWGGWRATTYWPSGSVYDSTITLKSDYAGGITFKRGDKAASLTKASTDTANNVSVNPCGDSSVNFTAYDKYGKTSTAHNVYMILESTGYIPNMNGFDVMAKSVVRHDWQIGQIWMGAMSESGTKSKHKCWMQTNAYGSNPHVMHDPVTGSFGSIPNYTKHQTQDDWQHWRVQTNDNMKHKYVKWVMVIWTLGTDAGAQHSHGFLWKRMSPRLYGAQSNPGNKGNVLFYPTSSRSLNQRKVILL